MSKKKLLAGLLAATMAFSCLTGCSTVKKSDLKGEMNEIAAATYGGENIYLDEINYYVRNTQISYEYYYSLYGMSDVWSQDAAVDSLFEESLASIYQTKVLYDYANDNGITLTEEEQTKITDMAEELAAATDHATVLAGQDKDMLTKIFTENALANKAYYTITEATKIKTTEDDCIKNAVTYILFNEKQEEEVADAEDETLDAAETVAETEEAVTFTEADANAALELVKDGTDIETVEEKYGLTCSTGNYNAKDEQTTELAKAAAQMKEGDAQVVYEEGEGWYLVVCTATKDEDASKSAYEDAVDAEKDEHFKEVYDGLKKKDFKVIDQAVRTIDVKNTPMLDNGTEEDTAGETEEAVIGETEVPVVDETE